MGIDKVSQWTATCDEGGCGDMEEVIWGDSDVFNQAQAIKEFRIRGWKIGRRFICPKCSLNLNNMTEEKNE